MGCCCPNLKSSKSQAVILDEWDSQTYSKAEGDLMKEKGNTYYRQGKYQEALGFYQQAILKYPMEPIYYSNQATCLRRLNRWQDALRSAQKALQIDGACVKAMLTKAICLAELSKQEKDQRKKTQMLNESRDVLQKVKRIATDDQQIRQIIEKVDILLEHCRKQKEKEEDEGFNEFIMSKMVEIAPAQLSTFYPTKESLSQDMKAFLKNKEQLEEYPDYLQDPITFQLFRKPFVSPSGITYERDMLLDHIRVNGPYDPTTKQNFIERQPFPNNNLMRLLQSHEHVTKWRRREKVDTSPHFINF